jgi:hypothetical protein
MSQGRKILYFIGAGATRAAGAYVPAQGGGRIPIPTQSEFWEVFLRLCPNRTARAEIERFLFRYFLGYRRVPSRTVPSNRRAQLRRVDVEEVFTFLSERSKAPSSSTQLKAYADRVWQVLVSQIGAVFSRFQPNGRTRRVVRRFHQKHVRSFDATVSFNYDSVVERSLPQAERWGYAGLEPCTNKLPVLKPHGSVNWERRNGQVLRVRATQSPVVVAPTHLKFIETATRNARTIGYLDDAVEVRQVWEEMERQMKAAKILVFIGYSFPVADLYFSSVLRSILADRDGAPNVVLVNPDAVSIAARLQARFPIPNIVKYFDLGQFIEAGRAGVERAVDAEPSGQVTTA